MTREPGKETGCRGNGGSQEQVEETVPEKDPVPRQGKGKGKVEPRGASAKEWQRGKAEDWQVAEEWRCNTGEIPPGAGKTKREGDFGRRRLR